MTKVYLTTYLSAAFALRDKPIRRRRCIATGAKVAIRPIELGKVSDGGDPEVSVPCVFVDGKPVAYQNHYSDVEWHTVDDIGPWWGTGLEFVTS